MEPSFVGATALMPAFRQRLGTVVQVATGSVHSCALDADGAVACWGYDGNRDSTVPADMGPGSIYLSAGLSGTCAIISNTTVDCWGHAPFVPASLNPVQRIPFNSFPPNPAIEGSAFGLSTQLGGSGNPVVFSSNTPGVCSVSGNLVTLFAGGTCRSPPTKRAQMDTTPLLR